MRDPSAKAILKWYDTNARALPWRVGPGDRRAGVRPDPYRVWLSEIMLQQTTVAAVKEYFLRFLELWPTVDDLAQAEDARVMAEWAGLGYYARARNLLKCARQIVAEHDGRFPGTREKLLTLPGVGPYTASAIAAIAFDEPAVVVDGNVERVMARLYQVATPLPKAKADLGRLAARLTPTERPGDYAQAVMDLGATVCTPRSPVCVRCPWKASCRARVAGQQVEFPVRSAKLRKPVRFGIVYLARRSDGAWLVETRPESGLLGGMLGWPGSDWREIAPTDAPPILADWCDVGAEVRHTFTHFHLRLSVKHADVGMDATPARGRFEPAFRPGDLPTVMRKAFDLAIAQKAT